MSRLRRNKKKKSSFSFFLIVFLLLAGAGGYAYITWFEGEKPLITVNNLPQYIGKSTQLSVTVSDQKSGLRTLRVVLIQKNKEKEILNKEYQRPGKNVAGTTEEKMSFALDMKALKLKEGDATLKISATDYSLRGMMKGNSTEVSHSIKIDTKPPKVTIIHSERYIKPGGAGIVVYRAEDTTKHGVMFNNTYHPGFPLTDGSDSKFISYIALQYSAKEITQSIIIAEDAAGNKTTKPFAPVLQKPNQKKDKINVSDGFLNRKIPEFEEHYPEMQGELVQKYLYSNRDIRQMNNKKIHDLCMNPGPKRLWAGKFLRMAGSGRAGFADHRTYYYKGEAIDKQVHLG
ncbi:MAG: M23 family peptidase, partial [Desulfocapsa sp.]|nr:M23 family peptidase [Desulfocapsa sp.]